MNGKKVKRIIVATALIAVLAISGISAYFTDGDTAKNTFTVGKVEIDLQEENWNRFDAMFIAPEQEFDKDPKVKNIGLNEAFVFLEVLVPYANVVTAQEDGTTNTAAETQLFTYTINSGWTQVGTREKTTFNGANVYKYVYAYGTNEAMTVLNPGGATTGTLFDYIKFANIVEDQAQTGGATLETLTQDVVVNAYAIQANNINDGKDSIDGKNDDGKTAPADVWAVLSKQAPTTVKTETENANTDVIEP